MLVVELKSEALKERHWKQLTKKLNVRWVLSDLTLGHVWDVDLIRHEPIVRDIILIAQGEMALEEFLKQVCRSLVAVFDLQYICKSEFAHIINQRFIVTCEQIQNVNKDCSQSCCLLHISSVDL